METSNKENDTQMSPKTLEDSSISKWGTFISQKQFMPPLKA